MDSQVTPCYIPLRELAFTESIETFTSYATASNTSSERPAANATTRHGLNGTEPAKNNASRDISSHVPSADTTTEPSSKSTNDEVSGTVTEETAVTSHVEPTEDAETPSAVEIATANGEAGIATTGVNATGASTAPIPTYSAEIVLCVPYCAALDEHDHCVAIKGCGYPEGGSFGRHGCCPPGFYSSSEVLGLVTFVTTVVIFVWCLRG